MEPPVSRLRCTALAVAYPFSLINPTSCKKKKEKNHHKKELVEWLKV
jgi:hypothetical protein